MNEVCGCLVRFSTISVLASDAKYDVLCFRSEMLLLDPAPGDFAKIAAS